jgi:non-ribosomal peptide synthase protein (TIGR01720 family)
LDSEQGFSGVNNSPFSTGRLLAEENDLPNAVSINGSIINGELTFIVSYDISKYKDSDLRVFCVAFHDALVEIIRHCAEAASGQRIPDGAPFIDAEISRDEYDELSSLYAKRE